MDRMSILPTIKCSSCGVDIDILHLADHVCVTQPPAVAASESTRLSDGDNSTRLEGGPSFSNRSNGQTPSSRMPPPARIDPRAANKPYRALEPSPVSSYGESRSLSPSPASVRPKSPMVVKRSATNPLAKSPAPPSPDLLSNMDSAFPPFPSKGATPRSAKPQTRERLELSYPPPHAEPSPLFAPLSPQVNGGGNVLKRMDSIAPGPFDGRRPSAAQSSKSTARSELSNTHRRNDSQKSWKSMASRSSTYSSRSNGAPNNGTYGTRSQPSLPPEPRQNESIDAFLNGLRTETMNSSKASSEKRSNTYPVRQGSGDRKAQPPYSKMPSERDTFQRDLPNTNASRSVTHPNGTAPSRNPSRNGSRYENTSQSGSRQPAPLVVPTFGNDGSSNSLYTPSDSGLSDDSYTSSGLRSVASSRSSPPGSIDGHSRNVSKSGRFDDFAKDPIERTASPDQYKDLRPTRGPGSFTRPKGPQPIFEPSSSAYSNMPESPMDPAIQMGGSFSPRPRVPLSERGRMQSLERSPPRQASLAGSRQPRTSKGNCRGCSEPIFGKSVKDSSGRLTGRYHKECFSCRTCGDSFPTAEFYVFENFPYCEQHYHKLNGSLCNWCDRGIEGQYLETDMRQKFHPRCFTCTTCRIPLRDGYYEVNGKRYCDRHGEQAAAPAPNYLGPGYKGRNMQKRRTRLMMMA